MSNIERRLAKLEAAMNPPEIEWLTITPDMDVEQAAATYRENLRRGNEHHRKYPERYEVADTQMTDEEAAEQYRELMEIVESFPRTTQLTNQQ